VSNRRWAVGALAWGVAVALAWPGQLTAQVSPAQAAPLAPVPSDSIVRLALDPARQGGRPYVILLDESSQRVEPDGRIVRRSRQVYQVLDQNAVRNMSERAFTYARSHQSLTIDWIRVLRPNGDVISDKAAQEQESDVPAPMANPVYQEQRMRRVSLGGVAVGTIVDVQATLEERAPARPGDFLVSWTANNPVPVVRSRLTLDAPESFAPRIVERNLNVRRAEVVMGGRRITTWTVNQAQPVRIEPFAADSNDVMMTVGIGSPSTWNDIAQWYAGLAKDRYTLTPAVAQRVDSLVRVSGARTRMDTIRAVHRWVAQDIRYLSVSLGIGGYQPRTPAEVLSTGFGDCKDKATLFVAALRRYRIAANPVLLSLNTRPDPALPSIFQFNHVIAAVAEGASWTYADLTAELVPYGMIPDAYQGQLGVIVMPDGSGREIRFPVAPIADNSSLLQISLRVDASGHAEGEVQETSRGAPSLGMRTLFSAPLDSSRRATVSKALAQRLFANDATVDSLRAPDGRDFAQPTSISYRVRADNVLRSVGESRLFAMSAGFIGPARTYRNLARELESQSTRLFPIDASRILGQTETISDVRITLPDGWRAELPRNVMATSFFGSYESTWTQEGREVHLRRRIVGARGIYPPQRLAEVIVWLKTVGADDYEFLSLKPTAPSSTKPTSGR
jgi:hypothetical protein